MSTRRFLAYFFAISAGSTVAFASSLKGQPLPPGEAPSEAGMVLTATDTGSDTLPSEPSRLFQAMRAHPRHRPAFRTAQVALVK